MFFQKKKSHYQKLKETWGKRQKDTQERLWSKHKEALYWITNSPKKLAIGSAASILMLASPASATLPSPYDLFPKEQVVRQVDQKQSLINDLIKLLPREVRSLTPEEEQKVSGALFDYFGFRVMPEVGDKRLNRTYGYIGQEQHLMRYPGDNLSSHFDSQEDAEKYGSYGMAPGKGAWGYFSESKEKMTERDVLNEKYYIAVQTFLAPNFLERVGEYRDFFKYKKMLLVNPENGKAMISVIGDAGTAPWTGKHLGGSPEVMKYLERVDGRQKGPVLYFFIDDPNDTIPLGPINIQKTQ